MLLLTLVLLASCCSAFNSTGWMSVELAAPVNYIAYHKVVSDKLQLALSINTTLVTSSSMWFGFGLPEQKGGSMTGADVVTVEFSTTQSDLYIVKDRYVPWAPFPLDLTTPSLYPEVDECQDWSFVSRSQTGGVVTFVVQRNLNTSDDQDRPIIVGRQKVIWAYGSGTVGYHGSNRGATVAVFIPGGNERLLSDVSYDLKLQFRISNLTVPHNRRTSYMCQGFKFPMDRRRSIVALEQITDSKSHEVNMDHHSTVWVCQNNSLWRHYYENPSVCIAPRQWMQNGSAYPEWYEQQYGKPFTGESPSGPPPGCTGVLWVWAVGMPAFVLPENVGYPVGGENDTVFFILDMHFDNPKQLANHTSTSGMTMYLTDTPQQHEAGVIITGDTRFVAPPMPKGLAKTTMNFTCHASCTKKFPQPINVFASFLHMHSYGRQIYTQHYRNSTSLGITNEIDFYNFNFQSFYSVNYTMMPGDELVTTCAYDTRKAHGTVHFGLGSEDEMCMDWISYYPLMRVNGQPWAMCAGSRTPNGTELDICAFTLAPAVVTPKVIPAPPVVSFGDKGVCPVDESYATPTVTFSGLTIGVLVISTLMASLDF